MKIHVIQVNNDDPKTKNLEKEKVLQENCNNEKDHIYLKEKLKKLGRTKLEVIFKRVSPIGDIKTIDRDGVLTILKTLQITSAGKDSVLSDLGFSGNEGDQEIVLSIDEFEKMLKC